jgi:hypothetical protein
MNKKRKYQNQEFLFCFIAFLNEVFFPVFFLHALPLFMPDTKEMVIKINKIMHMITVFLNEI